MYANASVEITMEEKHNDLAEIIAHDSKQIQAQAVINRPAPDDVTMIGFDDLPIADSLYITFLILLLSAA